MTTQTIYGYCPQCGAIGLSRERRPNGNDKCANGHTYPSGKALSQPNEPVARVIHQFETPEGTREILCVRLVDKLDVHTKLFATPPDQTAKIAELTAKVKELEEYIEIDCRQVIQNFQESDIKLTAKCEKMREALEFYADRKNWHKDSQQFGSFEVSNFNIIYNDFYEQNQSTRYAGNIAKQALEGV